MAGRSVAAKARASVLPPPFSISFYCSLEIAHSCFWCSLCSTHFHPRFYCPLVLPLTGVLVLEEYEHAKARGAPILAEFVGGAFTCDAHHMTEPEPNGKGVILCIERALASAGVAPEEVGPRGCGGLVRAQQAQDPGDVGLPVASKAPWLSARVRTRTLSPSQERCLLVSNSTPVSTFLYLTSPPSLPGGLRQRPRHLHPRR